MSWALSLGPGALTQALLLGPSLEVSQGLGWWLLDFSCSLVSEARRRKFLNWEDDLVAH